MVGATEETGRAPLKVPRVQKPSLCPIITRIIVLFIALTISLGTACTWWSWGYSWVVEESIGIYPIYECPQLAHTFAASLEVPDGPRCQVSLPYRTAAVAIIAENGFAVSENSNLNERRGKCVIPSRAHHETDIVCYSLDYCGNTCHVSGSSRRCPDPSSLDDDEAYGAVPLQCDILVGRRTDHSPVVVTMNCADILDGSYCNNDYSVSPSNIVAMRGLIAGVVLIVIFWFVAELILRHVDINLRKEKAEGLAKMAVELPEKRAYLRAQIELRWDEEAQLAYKADSDTSSISGTAYDLSSVYSHQMGSAAPTATTAITPRATPRSFAGPYDSVGGSAGLMDSKVRSQLRSRDPRKRYESNAWRRRLRQWKELREQKLTTFLTKQRFRTILLNIFFLLLIIITLYLIIYFSPQQMKSKRTALDALFGNISIWRMSSWLDLLIFIDVILDTFLFLIACCVVKWPRAPVFSRHLQVAMKIAVDEVANEGLEEGRGYEEDHASPMGIHNVGDEAVDLNISRDSSEDTVTADFVMNQSMTRDCCLMVACHMSTMTAERFDTFTTTLRSAMMVFPPGHIFVCDNGPSLCPQDHTQWAVQQVHPDINYLYIPEGNKTFAFYWCNKYWIPFLSRYSRVKDFRFAVIIDDDVPLPPDLHIPQEHLEKDHSIKAVGHWVPSYVREKPWCQDVEYKMAAVHKLLQATMSRCLSCHGAIALWDREALDEVFYEHDTVFNGEDMYMGLSLLRKRDNSKIISCAQAVVPTYAPDSWTVLFRQRVKSWELTSHKKTFSYLFEVFHPASFCHVASLALKPYFMQEASDADMRFLGVHMLADDSVREDEIRDIPPCPPHPDVDWFTVWVQSEPVEKPLTASHALPSVLIDAFGAHGLRSKPNITPRDIEVWQTAARYQILSSIGIIIAANINRRPGMNYPALLLSLGTLFFSASLYALVLTGVKRLGVVAPVGGLLMAAGWFAMAF
ncbi:hypothetical protein Pmar_PMAR013485 [Perkinsus marinus ATCC 50983]|uniref:Uncharacterized protein n=1 Tax=Perkinsus marinus (strain ATCC 50983 / TXsc) TaxID=423536 RepID=C5L1Z1_PERM5|nr:hypothetical protein Pmar_PMAR013485 [Perkinsus marinus ATCC 50983]EER09260.1 hypothetical protein Pmar_PMAR013485 [Perkinsus marinus ATCC 50983]|eukprot:XP_002777444.1 hypothetical protein Pmar_PMAR013485 [Perkinsus marinus ATCC 50983]